jgi:hypothetical protein
MRTDPELVPRLRGQASIELLAGLPALGLAALIALQLLLSCSPATR